MFIWSGGSHVGRDRWQCLDAGGQMTRSAKTLDSHLLQSDTWYNYCTDVNVTRLVTSCVYYVFIKEKIMPLFCTNGSDEMINPIAKIWCRKCILQKINSFVALSLFRVDYLCNSTSTASKLRFSRWQKNRGVLLLLTI